MSATPPKTDSPDSSRELAYLRRRMECLAASLVQADLRTAQIRHELEQKRRGFTLMGELAASLGLDASPEDAFIAVSSRINSALNMQRTAVLVPRDDRFVPVALHGYSPESRRAIMAGSYILSAEFLSPLHPVLVTAESPAGLHADLRLALGLTCFIATPVMLHGEVMAVLLTGRLREQRPFLPRLGTSDVETVQAVSAYLTAVLASQRLRAVEQLANLDPLTELPNLRQVRNYLANTLALSRREGFSVALMFVDLDGFKAINDSLSHAAGDWVLCTVAERLRGCVRESDTVGRIGGDEFVIVLSRIEGRTDASRVARAVLAALEQPIMLNGTRCKVGASIGIACCPEHAGTVEALLSAADEAMYSVKTNGKHGFRFAVSR